GPPGQPGRGGLGAEAPAAAPVHVARMVRRPLSGLWAHAEFRSPGSRGLGRGVAVPPPGLVARRRPAAADPLPPSRAQEPPQALAPAESVQAVRAVPRRA